MRRTSVAISGGLTKEEDGQGFIAMKGSAVGADDLDAGLNSSKEEW